MPGQYGQYYTDNNGSQYNWNESLGKYERMKRNQRDRSGTPTINTSAFAQQFKNRRAIKVNPDGKTRNTVGGSAPSSSSSERTPSRDSSMPDKEMLANVISLAKRGYNIDEITTKTAITRKGVIKILSLAEEAGHKLNKRSAQNLLDEQLFEYLEYGDETEEVQKSLSEDPEVLQKSEPAMALPSALPVTLLNLSLLMKARTEYKLAQVPHHHH